MEFRFNERIGKLMNIVEKMAKAVYPESPRRFEDPFAQSFDLGKTLQRGEFTYDMQEYKTPGHGYQPQMKFNPPQPKK